MGEKRRSSNLISSSFDWRPLLSGETPVNDPPQILPYDAGKGRGGKTSLLKALPGQGSFQSFRWAASFTLCSLLLLLRPSRLSFQKLQLRFSSNIVWLPFILFCLPSPWTVKNLIWKGNGRSDLHNWVPTEEGGLRGTARVSVAA